MTGKDKYLLDLDREARIIGPEEAQPKMIDREGERPMTVRDVLIHAINLAKSANREKHVQLQAVGGRIFEADGGVLPLKLKEWD